MTAKGTMSSKSEKVEIQSKSSSIHSDDNMGIKSDEIKMEGGSNIRITSADTDIM